MTRVFHLGFNSFGNFVSFTFGRYDVYSYKSTEVFRRRRFGEKIMFLSNGCLFQEVLFDNVATIKEAIVVMNVLRGRTLSHAFDIIC